MSMASADRDDPTANRMAFADARRAFRRARGTASRVQKRAFDIAFVLAGAPFIIPLVAVFWLLVKLDGGPGFYGQPRVGYGGRVFTCWKLRTMVRDADAALTKLCESDPEIAREWRQTQKLKKDPRITRLGAFMRKTSIDEFPQFWNVLWGEMSIVGPRPLVPGEIDRYGEHAEVYLGGVPGLTGLWQISGRNRLTYSERVQLDVQYARTQSLALDVSIVLRTIPEVLWYRSGL